MSQYCDSKVLEDNWYDWLVASSVPSLERFRVTGLLWTKALDKVKDDDGNDLVKSGKTFIDPCSYRKSHCIAISQPIYFNSYGGSVQHSGTMFIGGKPTKVSIDGVDDGLIADPSVVGKIESTGYKMDKPTDTTWHYMLNDINKICQGISKKFNPPSEEEYMELSHEALLQVTNKLVNHKLVYTPGKAPVFNLLTTTIFRCMYSILNKKKNQRNGIQRVRESIKSGTLPNNIRSFKVSTQPKWSNTKRTTKVS